MVRWHYLTVRLMAVRSALDDQCVLPLRRCWYALFGFAGSLWHSPHRRVRCRCLALICPNAQNLSYTVDGVLPRTRATDGTFSEIAAIFSKLCIFNTAGRYLDDHGRQSLFHLD